MAEDISDIVSEKHAGLPLWAWGGIAGAGIAIFVWLKNRSKAASGPVTNADVASVLGSMAAQTGGVGGGGAAGGQAEYVAAPSESDWLSDAVRAVAGDAGGSVNAVNALSKFMSGLTLSPSEQSIVDKAIAQYGLPPGFSSSTAGNAAANNQQYGYSDQITDLFGALAQQQQDLFGALSDSWQSSMESQNSAVAGNVPGTALVTPKKYTFTAGDTIQSVAAANNLTIDQLLALNPLSGKDFASVGHTVTVGAANAPSAAVAKTATKPDVRYVFQKGDTYASVAKAFGYTEAQLRAMNPKAGPQSGQAGTAITIKGG